MYQPVLGNECMDLHTPVMPGDEVVPDGRRDRGMEVTLMRGRRKGCQSGIGDGQEDGRNQGGF